jgi:hypothetical protein
VGGSWSNHVWLEKESFNKKSLAQKFAHDSSENSLGNLSTCLDGMVTVNQDLWLNDWDKTVLLADRSVSGKSVGVGSDSSLGWEARCWVDLEDSSPLGKSYSHSVVLGTSLAKSIKSLSGSLIWASAEVNDTSVHLDSAVNSSSLENLNESGSIGSIVSDSLVEHDHSTDVLLDSWGSEEKLSVSNSVFVGILNGDSIESLSNGSGGLVSCEDSLSWGADFLCDLDELILELS